MNKQTGVYIPARLNSERLPKKLILPFGGTCLFDIACNKLNNLPDEINKYVLVYEDELIQIAKKYKNIKIIIRSEESANAEEPLSFLFNAMKNVEDTHLMFLNPCLAFLKISTIIESLNSFNNSKYDYATSVKSLQNWLFNMDGTSINEVNYKELNTKFINPVYQAAHCFHIFNKNIFFEDGYMLKKEFLPIIISKEEVIDVDTQEEYYYAKWRWENIENKGGIHN